MVKSNERPDVDVRLNRQGRKWSRREQFARVLWMLIRPLFLFSPRPMWGWRRLLLRMFGARVGAEVHVCPSVRIAIPWHLNIGDQSAIGEYVTLYALGPINIGKRVTVSQGSHLCAGTHDFRLPDRPLLKLPIVIQDDAWVCADAFIGPDVTIGKLAIVGARAVAMKDVAPGSIVVGNPARELEKDTT